MKKILLLMTMVLTCVGAWAQTTKLEAGKYYRIKGTHSTNPWLTGVVENGGIDVATNEANAGIYQWTGTHLRELITGKYLGTNNNQITLLDNNTYKTTIEVSDGNRLLIKNGDRYLYNNKSDYTREAGNLTSAGTNDPKWYFYEVTPLFTIDNIFNGRGSLCFGNYNGSEYFGLSNITLSGYTNSGVTVNDNKNKYWYITRTDNGLYIYNVGKGCFLQHRSGDVATCVRSFAKGFTGEYRTKNNNHYVSFKSSNYYLTYSPGYSPNQGQVRWLTDNEENATLLTLTNVTDNEAAEAADALIKDHENPYTLNVSSVGWATLYLGYPAEIPNGIQAYLVKEGGIKDGYVSLESVSGVLPAYTGIIVNAQQNSYTFNCSLSETAVVDGNLLQGTVKDLYINGDAYVLSAKSGIGLYKADLNNEGNFLNNANKAYLPATAVTSGVKALRFNFDGETTAIETVETENANAPIYDLSGRRVLSTVKGGVYIQNGKKFIVK